jgi:hypothetical protein
MADKSTTDKAPVAEAWGSLLDQLTDGAIRNAKKCIDAGVGRLETFQVIAEEAERFEPGPDGKPVAIIDTDEKGTKPLNITFRIAGIQPPPKLDPNSGNKPG